MEYGTLPHEKKMSFIDLGHFPCSALWNTDTAVKFWLLWNG